MPEESVAEERIALALLELLNVKPFDRISITEITEKASVSRVSYYRHFSSREDILLKHCTYVLDSIVEGFRSGIISNCYDFWQRLYKYLGETNLVSCMQKAGLEKEFFCIFEDRMAIIFSEIMGIDLAKKMNLVLLQFVIGGFTALLRRPSIIKHGITNEDVAAFLRCLEEHIEKNMRG